MQDLSKVLHKLATTKPVDDGQYIPPVSHGEGDKECKACGGLGWITANVPVTHPEFGKLTPCECRRGKLDAEQYERLLRFSNLGQLESRTFESLDRNGPPKGPHSQLFQKAYDVALEYSLAPSGWLIITGPNGSGKTHLASAIANQSIENGMVVFFTHAPDLLDHLRSSFGPTSAVTYTDLFEQVRQVPMLILDGVGSQSTTSWAEEKLRQIINSRYNEELPTIITTSANFDDLDPYIATRTSDERVSTIISLGNSTPTLEHGIDLVPKDMLKRMTFEQFQIRQSTRSSQMQSLQAAFEAAEHFASHPEGWLTLFSQNTGVGKTHLAVAVAGEQIKSGRSVFFAFVPELLDYLRYTFTPESTIRYDRVFEDVKNTPLLILDDLGHEHSSPWAQEKLYQIVVHRHNNRLPTLITSSRDFTEDSGPISSRIQDASTGIFIRIEADDYRKKGRRG